MDLVRRLMTNIGTTPNAGSRPHHDGPDDTETVLRQLGLFQGQKERLSRRYCQVHLVR
jgi:hypothetical protein